jgi:hypothetical protein
VQFIQFWAALNLTALRLHILENLELGKQIESEEYIKIQHTYTTILHQAAAVFFLVVITFHC